MASTLLGGSGRDRVVTKGHGTEALGPSDTSDSARDIEGAPEALKGTVNSEVMTQASARRIDLVSTANAPRYTLKGRIQPRMSVPERVPDATQKSIRTTRGLRWAVR